MMFNVQSFIDELKLSDSIISWQPYPNDFIPLDRFSTDDWNKIFPHIHTEREWKDFIQRMGELCAIRLLVRKADDKCIGFIFLASHDNMGRTIVFHGGGWEKSVGATLMYYRGLRLIVGAILRSRHKVMTSWANTNTVAERFLRSVGFVPSYKDSTHTYAWINLQRLESKTVKSGKCVPNNT